MLHDLKMFINCPIITTLTRVGSCWWVIVQHPRRYLAHSHGLPQDSSQNLSRRDWRTHWCNSSKRCCLVHLQELLQEDFASKVKLGHVKFAQLAVSMTVLWKTLASVGAAWATAKGGAAVSGDPGLSHTWVWGIAAAFLREPVSCQIDSPTYDSWDMYVGKSSYNLHWQLVSNYFF